MIERQVRHDPKWGSFVRLVALLALAALGLTGCEPAQTMLPSHSSELQAASRSESSNADCESSKKTPCLILDDSVASDFGLLAQETWDAFLAVFEQRSQCFGNVRLVATRTLDSRASYHPESATAFVRVPGTPAMLQGALVHELAHHLEFQCKAHEQLRPAFLAAQGFPADMAWRPGPLPANVPVSDWENIPSEHFAEATIDLVLGRRAIPAQVRVKPEALEVIREWANAPTIP